MKSDIVERSKYLSLLLRHKPQLAKLEIKEDGWISVKELIKNTDFTLCQLKNIVSSDSKQRYSFNQTNTHIRANQGHSVSIKMNYDEFIPLKELYHGTSIKVKDQIISDGIKKMNRQYVHLSQDIDTALKVGKRHGRPFIFKVDALKMLEDGIKFYISDNKVVLVDFVDKKYLEPVFLKDSNK